MQELDNLEALKERLHQSKLKLIEIKHQLDLPPAPAEFKHTVKKSCLPPALERLVLFLLDNQGARTDVISRKVAIGNVSDCYRKKGRLEDLRRIGVEITCKTLPSLNRFGAPTIIGHLFISPTAKNKQWQKVKAANDER